MKRMQVMIFNHLVPFLIKQELNKNNGKIADSVHSILLKPLIFLETSSRPIIFAFLKVVQVIPFQSYKSTSISDLSSAKFPIKATSKRLEQNHVNRTITKGREQLWRWHWSGENGLKEPDTTQWFLNETLLWEKKLPCLGHYSYLKS